MDINYIKSVLLEIQRATNDDETQHMMEDDLLWTFVKFVSERPEQYPAAFKLMATEILKSREIEFKRLCA